MNKIKKLSLVILVVLLSLFTVVGISACSIEESYLVKFEMNGIGKAPEKQIVLVGEKVTKPADPEVDGYTFEGWYEDKELTTPFDFEKVITKDLVIYANWTEGTQDQPQEPTYELVTTVLDIQALVDTYGEAKKITEDVTVGKFKFSKGLYFNQSTGNMEGAVINNQKKLIYITLTGVDNTNSIQFDAKSASSSSTGNLSLYNSKDEVVADFGDITDPQYELKAENLPADTYYLKSASSIRIARVSITEKLEKSEAVGISVKGAVEKELQGREFSSQGLNVSLHYSNGRVDTVTSGYTVDSSKVDMNTPGTYPVTVSYAVSEASEPFTATYEIVVYSIDKITLSNYVLNKSRVTMPVQKVFGVGEAFNSNNLAVSVECSAPNSNEKEVFVLGADEYTISSVEDIQSAGAKTITVTVGNKTASYEVYYVDKTNADINNIVVDANAESVTANGGVYTVKSVNMALQLFKVFGTAAEQTKTITVNEGEYYEKVEIDLPNVKLIGNGNVVLWCDILAGQADPSGATSYSTDGSASVSIRQDAVGFYAENITFKNYYNTHELYTYSKTLMSDTQAVACLVQADKVYFKNCNFTSYHDTLYAMYGRQVYENCNIEGRTDYIFGADSTCYFKNCTIKTISANDRKNGGYIVATKGTKGLLYGYIFDGCTLTAEEGVVAGTVSLARGWDKYMTLAFVNCNISAAYSKEYFGEATTNADGTAAPDNKNDRYTNMNAEPVATQLFEYNNTGDGALTAEQIASADENGLIEKICTYLTAEQAAQYSDFTKIFAQVQTRTGAADYSTPYTDAWDGSAGAKITSLTYDFAIYEQNYKGITVQEQFKNDFTITIPAEITSSKLRWNGNSVQFDIGTQITFLKKGKIYIDWFGGNYGNSSNGVITYKDGYATLTIVASAGNSGVYIKNIKLNLEEVPEDTVNYNVTFDYGYDGVEALVVGVPGGNFVSEPTMPTRDGYEFDGWYTVDGTLYDFNNTVNSELTLTAKWVEITDPTITEDTVYNFAGTDAYTGSVAANEVKKWQKMVMNGGTKGSFAKHNDSYFTLKGDATLTFTLKKGATVTFTTYDGHLVINGVTIAADQYTDNGKKYTYTVAADGEVVVSLEAGANQIYFSQIEVATTDALLKPVDKAAVEAGVSYKYEQPHKNTEYFVLRGCADNGDWLNIPVGGKITFFVEAGATITVGGSPYDGSEPVLSIGENELVKDAANNWTFKSEQGGKIELVNTSVKANIYIKTIKVQYDVQEVVDPNPDILQPTQSVTFGTDGNYSTYIANGKIKLAGNTIRDNGSNNSQINDGAVITLKVWANTALVVEGYPNYTNYTVKVNGVVVSGNTALTQTTWTYVVKTDATVEFLSGANNYFYSITAVNAGAFTYKFADEQAKYQQGDAIQSNENFTISGCVKHDNTYVALKENNQIVIFLAAGSTLKIHMPYSGGVTVNGQATELQSDYLTYTATTDGYVTISATAGGAYFTEISVTLA